MAFSTEGLLEDPGMSGSMVKPLPYLLVTFLLLGFIYKQNNRQKTDAPLLNAREMFEISNKRPLGQFFTNTRGLLWDWFTAHPNKPARIISDAGKMTILPPSMANEIRNNPHLSFSQFSYDYFHARYPGFEAQREGAREHLLVPVINRDLTKSLAKLTRPLVEETGIAMSTYLGESKEWTKFPVRDTLLCYVTQISSRVFLGQELCRNETWLKVARDYAVTSLTAIDSLRSYPEPLKHIISRVSPLCREAQAQVELVRSVLDPVMKHRNAVKAAAAAEGKSLEFNDALEWFAFAAAKGNHYYDPAAMQLALSLVAIHTTTDLMAQMVIDLAPHPEVIEALRDEVREVLTVNGWKKSALSGLKLLDSVMKESQRLKPIELATMQRKAMADVKLSDGTFIPKGSILSVSTHKHWDDATYPDAKKWDAYRFYNMRLSGEPGKENTSQTVSTSPEHMGFGYGMHACPGRFFASNEIKIAMAFILMNYDWKLVPGTNTNVVEFGITLSTSPTAEIMMRKRDNDFDLSNIQFQ